MAQLDANVKKVFEYVTEPTLGTFPTDPTMLGIHGYITKATVDLEPTIEHFPYLKGAADTNFSQSTKNVKVSEAFGFNIEYVPTSWEDLKYVLGGGTEGAPAIGDAIDNLGLGTVINDQYQTFSGAVISDFECTMEPESPITCTISGMMVLASAISGSDYIGTGSHVASPTAAPLTYSDISTVLIDGGALTDPMPNLSWAVSYSVDPIFDAGVTWASKIKAWARGQRNISLKHEMDLEDLTQSTALMAGADHTNAFTLGGSTFTFSKIKWESKYSQSHDPEDTIAMPLDATFCDLVIT